jgi:CheY-like chemotaxis protein
MAFTSRSSFIVALKGFSRTEEIALHSMLALSERRALRYVAAAPGDTADMLIVDAHHADSVNTLRLMPFGTVALLIGTSDHGLLYPTLARPYEWTELLHQIDTLVRLQQTDEASPNPRSPPTIPLADILYPPGGKKASTGGARAWRAPHVSPPTVWPGYLEEGSVLDTLPMDAAALVPPAPEPDRALLVGMNSTVNDFVRDQLLTMGIVSETALLHTAVADAVLHHPIQWVVIDMDHDKTAAMALCKSIKTLSAPVHVLMLTRELGFIDKMRVRLCGADSVLDKPLSPAQLQDAVQALRPPALLER